MTTTNASDYADLFDYMIEWLDATHQDAWWIVEEAARLQSVAAGRPNDLNAAGRVHGMAFAIAVLYDRENGWGIEEADAQPWVAFIEDFAESNYEDGERIE